MDNDARGSRRGHRANGNLVYPLPCIPADSGYYDRVIAHGHHFARLVPSPMPGRMTVE